MSESNNTHLAMRMRSTATRFTSDLHLEDPSVGLAPGAPPSEHADLHSTSGEPEVFELALDAQPVDLDAHRPRVNRRRWAIPAVAGAAAAALAVAVWPSGSDGVDVTTDPAAMGGFASAAPQVSPIGQLASMAPRDALQSMFDATLAAESFVAENVVVDPNGVTNLSETESERSYIWTTRSVYNASGLVATEQGPGDGDWYRDAVADTNSSTEYLRLASGEWRSSTYGERDTRGVDDPTEIFSTLLTPQSCVTRVDERTFLVIGEPNGSCPESVAPAVVMSSEGAVWNRDDGEMPDLGRQLVMISADDAGRVGLVSHLGDDEMLRNMFLVTRYDQYDSAPEVQLPAESSPLPAAVVGLKSGAGAGYTEIQLADGSVVEGSYGTETAAVDDPAAAAPEAGE